APTAATNAAAEISICHGGLLLVAASSFLQTDRNEIPNCCTSHLAPVHAPHIHRTSKSFLNLLRQPPSQRTGHQPAHGPHPQRANSRAGQPTGSQVRRSIPASATRSGALRHRAHTPE